MRPVRVLLAKVGVDLHDRGIKVVARALRDAGMEVVYLGPGALPEAIARGAVDEDVDVIGVSTMEGMHHVKIPHLMAELGKIGSSIPVICGGIIPPKEAEELRRRGVKEVFSPGSSLKEIVAAFRKHAEETRVHIR